MPGGDGTGPMGMGPMTGRAAGYCAGYGVPGFVNPVPGRGFRLGFGRGRGFWGRGGGRGWRNMFYATGLTGWQRAAMGWPGGGFPLGSAAPAGAASEEDELRLLEQQAGAMGDALERINQRIAELRAGTAKKE